MAGIFYTCLLNAFFVFHPFFVSVTELKQNAKEKTVEISSKLFIDDFEKALSATYKTQVDLSKPAGKEQTDQWMAAYFRQHFQLKINGKAVPVTFIGYEKEGEAAWCYLQVSGAPAAIQQVEVTSNVLYEQFESQIHIIHATVNGERKSTKISNPEKTAVFIF